jgi:uncharacterized protein (DUF1330 family)
VNDVPDTQPVIAVFEVRLRPDADADALARYDEYKARVAPLILAAGGRYLARAAAGTFLEGDPDDGGSRRFHVIEFPSASAAHSFWSSDDYAAIIPLRDGAIDVRAVVIG